MRAYAPVLALSSLTAVIALPTDQQPLQDTFPTSFLKVQEELKKAEIIPTVIDDFLPSLMLAVSWKKGDADLGNTIKPKRLQTQPSIALYDEADPDGLSSKAQLSYVVTLTDPDAPSRDNPEWSEMCHWIAANVSVSQETVSNSPMPMFGTEEYEQASGPDDVIAYKPPGPPKKTGKHRYVFLAFAPRNGTTAPLHLTRPMDRQHWGTGAQGGGVRDWARENDLVPVAANFLYSQHKKQ